ncbi:MAG: NUDIX hydrolase [Eubacteriaceae bacterium]|jgi:ADP-ribose pyrophosphatase
MMDQTETRISEKEIYDGRIVRFHVDEIRLPNDGEASREVVDHLPGVSILTVKDGCFYFVKQFRYAVHKLMTEIPAGLIDPGETPKEAAIRELQEEVGLKPRKLEYLCSIQPSPGFLDEEHTIFMADEFTENKLDEDDDEFLQVVRIPIRTARMLFKHGYFEDAKTVCALGYYFSR